MILNRERKNNSVCLIKLIKRQSIFCLQNAGLAKKFIKVIKIKLLFFPI